MLPTPRLGAMCCSGVWGGTWGGRLFPGLGRDAREGRWRTTQWVIEKGGNFGERGEPRERG